MPNYPIEIVSPQNQRVKDWASLLERRGREKQGQFLIEGVRLVEEAVQAKAPIRTILYSLDKGLPEALYDETADHIEWIGVSEAVLSKCTDTQTPQGLVAVVDKLGYKPSDFLGFAGDLVVAVDGVQDPGNLGTIIRSADAVGAHGVLLGKGTVDLYNPKTVRSTMGSMFHLPIAECDLRELLPQAQQKGVQLVVTDLTAEQSCYEMDLSEPTWLVFGNEGRGISQEIAALVDKTVIIPMKGQSESLNVAMAATVLLFEAMRQRLK